MKEFGAKNQTFGRLMDKGLKSVATAGLGDKKAGYEQTQKATVKARAEYANSLGYDKEKLTNVLTQVNNEHQEKMGNISLDKEIVQHNIEKYQDRINKATTAQEREQWENELEKQKAEMSRLEDVEKQAKKDFEGKKKTEGDKVKNERKNAAKEYYEQGSVLNKLSRKLGRKTKISKTNQDTVDAIDKQKSTADKIMEAIKEQEKQESEGKSDKGGGEKKEDKK
jgi:hypothetical protein